MGCASSADKHDAPSPSGDESGQLCPFAYSSETISNNQVRKAVDTDVKKLKEVPSDGKLLSPYFEQAVHHELAQMVSRAHIPIFIVAECIPASYKVLVAKPVMHDAKSGDGADGVELTPINPSTPPAEFFAETVALAESVQTFVARSRQLIETKSPDFILESIVAQGLTFIFSRNPTKSHPPEYLFESNSQGFDLEFSEFFDRIKERAADGWQYVGNLLGTTNVYVRVPWVVNMEHEMVSLKPSRHRFSRNLLKFIAAHSAKGWRVLTVINKKRNNITISTQHGPQSMGVTHQNCVIFERPSRNTRPNRRLEAKQQLQRQQSSSELSLASSYREGGLISPLSQTSSLFAGSSRNLFNFQSPREAKGE